jgi:flavin reductase (DIM6/NTAB) family NADH-FMN oxidoreductase RutF
VGHPGGQMNDELHPVGPDQFRAVMGHFATGVAVITATSTAGPVGMTANAVCSLSLDPLLLLVCFDEHARTFGVVRDSRRFGVNVLAAGQEHLARLFASKAPEHEKFAEVEHTVHDGIPVIEGTLAWVGCRLERLVPGGDHVIGIGAVETAEVASGPRGEERDPLVWYRGAYGTFRS